MPDTPALPGSGAPDGGPDLLARVAAWFGSLLTDIVGVLADPEGSAALLGDFGWTGTPPVLPPSLLSRLDTAAQGGTDPGAAKMETYAEIVIALAALTEAMAAAKGDMSAHDVPELVADLLDVTALLRLRRAHPTVWAILRALSLLSDDGAQLANLGDLVGDTQKYLLGLTTGPGYAQDYQDWSTAILGAVGLGLSLIPSVGEHGPDQTSLRSEVIYGWTTAGPLDHPNLAQLLARTLTWRLDLQLSSKDAAGQLGGGGEVPGLEQTIDLTVALVPPEHDRSSWGVFVRLSGASAVTFPIGRARLQSDGTSTPSGWQITIASTDVGAVEMLFPGAAGDLGQSYGFIRGTTSGFTASVAVERPDQVAGSWLIGPSSGTHVEVQHFRAAFTFAEDGQGPLLDLSMRTDHVILNIELGGDTFLGAVLPPSLRLDTKIEIGVDTRRGVYLGGGAALVVDLPVTETFGWAGVFQVSLEALHLRLSVTPPASGGDGQAGTSFAVAFTADIAITIGGVVSATIAGIGAAYVLGQVAPSSTGSSGSTAAGPPGPGTAGRWQPGLHPAPPDGIGLVISAALVTGGGFLRHDPLLHQYTGALQIQIQHLGGLGVTALGQVDTGLPDTDGAWALLAIVTVTFEHGVPLPLGFSLTGFGAIFAHNHTIDTDAIAAGLRTKALDAILFPPDPVAQAPHIFAVWKQTMPVAVGHTLLGLMARLSWGVGTHFGSFELAVLVEFGGGPIQFVLLGTLRLDMPTEKHGLLRLRADILGRLTLSPFNAQLLAEVYDSKLGTFTISGSVLAVVRTGPDPAYLLSVGGFNPHFTPPGGLPALNRFRVDISGSNNPSLRLEGYFAVTWQSIQLGARAQLHAAAGPVALDGWCSFDALIERRPQFLFSVELSAGMSLSYHGDVLAEVSADVLLIGPGPWHVHGYASFSVLFFSVSIPIDKQWGDAGPPTSSTADPLTLVRAALSDPGAWSASLPAGQPTLITLRHTAGTALPAHPLADLTCRQDVVPLGLTVTHLGDQPLAAPTSIDLTGLQLAGAPATGTAPVTDAFASAQFLDLTDDQTLSRPSFEIMRSGLSTAGADADRGSTTLVATTYKTVAVDGTAATARPRWPLDARHARAVLSPDAPPAARPAPPRVSVAPDTLRTVAGTLAPPLTAGLAAQSAGRARLLDQVALAGERP